MHPVVRLVARHPFPRKTRRAARNPSNFHIRSNVVRVPSPPFARNRRWLVVIEANDERKTGHRFFHLAGIFFRPLFRALSPERAIGRLGIGWLGAVTLRSRKPLRAFRRVTPCGAVVVVVVACIIPLLGALRSPVPCINHRFRRRDDTKQSLAPVSIYT